MVYISSLCVCTLSIIIIDKDKPSDVKQTDDVFCDAHNHDWLSCTEGVGATGAVHITNERRKLSVTNSKKKLGNIINIPCIICLD